MDVLLTGLRAYLYTLVSPITSPNLGSPINKIVVTLIIAVLTIQFIGDPQTQYKDDSNEIILLGKFNLSNANLGNH